MADCTKYEDWISCYVDGELPEKDKEALLAHISDCKSCQALLSVYRSVSEAAGESMLDVPEGFSIKVMEKIHELPPETARHNRTGILRKSLRPVIITFAAAAACLALVFLMSPKLFDAGGSSQNATMSAKEPVIMEAQTEDTASGGAQDTASKTISPQADGTPAAAAPDNNAEESGNTGTADKTETPEGGMMYSVVGSEKVASSPDVQMGAVAAPGTGSAPAPEKPTSLADDQALLREYYAVITIKGTLPDVLENADRTENQDGTYSIVVTTETAKQLIKDGYTTVLGNEKAESALVNYSAE